MVSTVIDSCAISLRGISKRYKLYHSAQDRLLESLIPFGAKRHNEFWALRGIDLDVQKGRTLGILGRNGSGKSTLLQILTGVSTPTTGAVEMRGKVSVLLDLGLGFNPEFTGRENVLLQGSLLGLREDEIRRRLPEIEKFAEIGPFFDQPVRVYSSGMYVRLAFSAAIHVDPDILVVDEALAVGDAKFQHRCYQKFHDFQAAGKTIVFVTHDMQAVLKHADEAIVLEHGTIALRGSPAEVVPAYMEILDKGSADGARARATSPQHPANAPEQDALSHFLVEDAAADSCARRRSYNPAEYHSRGNRAAVVDYLLVSGDQHDPAVVESGAALDLYVKARYSEDVAGPLFGVSLKTVDGVMVYALNSFFNQRFVAPAKAGDTIVFRFSLRMDVADGDYFLDIGLDERAGGSFANIERRSAMIHLVVLRKRWFHGLADLKGDCGEATRRSSGRPEAML